MVDNGIHSIAFKCSKNGITNFSSYTELSFQIIIDRIIIRRIVNINRCQPGFAILIYHKTLNKITLCEECSAKQKKKQKRNNFHQAANLQYKEIVFLFLTLFNDPQFLPHFNGIFF
ncbi:hypothetical protein D9M68_714430 [compost metagenome]